ncbi:intracellular protein transport protein USO1 [Verticillium alfalfae VaMs.102]|uniref:Intracellular protein transport protein USO1 n=1 Tax=Verticillium alfalfae (strain VaMs.102 / ATCC MYA-4576 / FGSC 10136) TaxID=526221 RepID=C9SA95_VERA1|nr:intracellular protein transport protein USO1 [Verticillium alfalfae VaMs.102]EEY15372.1 intracellular protein transport protein USO1 [Verticillium alfalfae VaMs.102]
MWDTLSSRRELLAPDRDIVPWSKMNPTKSSPGLGGTLHIDNLLICLAPARVANLRSPSVAINVNTVICLERLILSRGLHDLDSSAWNGSNPALIDSRDSRPQRAIHAAKVALTRKATRGAKAQETSCSPLFQQLRRNSRFAKDFPATVASGALRSLIGSLSNDGEDVDTVKVVLETLLMLFSPNQDSPEASDEIVLWLADEFTQRQDNITLLLDFLEGADFYSRLYSLQLLTAILAARAERTEELFSIIALDGSLADGGRVVEDCLILLANLLRANASNQSLFRESGGVKNLATLLQGVLQGQAAVADDVAGWVQAQRGRNIYALLAVVRLLLVHGAVGTAQNQLALWQHGLLYHALRLSFSAAVQTPVKAEESFAQLQVPSPLSQPSSGARDGGGPDNDPEVYVIDGLLDLTLAVSANDMFDVRIAACDCLKAYFFDHAEIRLHFLKRAIEGYKTGLDETANVLAVLLRPYNDDAIVNPYRPWFAAIITFHLLFNNPEAKSLAMAVTEGDAEDGEEIVTSIQSVAAHLLSGLGREQDSRVATGYLILLLGWMFEDLEAVNDFLAEGRLCAMILGEIYEFSTKDSLFPRASLHAILLSRLGKEKFIDRLSRLRTNPLMRDFEVLPQKLDPSSPGRLPEVFFDITFVDFFKDNYSRILRAIDRDPGLEIPVSANGVQQGISRDLVDSLRAQLGEKSKALDELHMASTTLERQLGQEQADHRKSRENAAVDIAKVNAAVDAVRRDHAAELNKMRQQLASEQAEHARQLKQAIQSKEVELEAERRKLVSVQEDYKRQIDYTKKTSEAELEKLRRKMASLGDDHEKQLSKASEAAEVEVGRLKRRADAEAADLRATISRLEVDLMKTNKNKAQELHTLQEEHTARLKLTQQQSLAKLEKQIDLVEESVSKCARLEKELNETRQDSLKIAANLAEVTDAKQAIQTELDDLLMVFADVEDKVSKYKARLRKIGLEVSDGEDEESEDESEDGQEQSDDDVESEDEAGSGRVTASRKTA